MDGKGINRVENCRHVQQKLGQHGPQILHVSKEHVQRRKEKSHAEVEHQQHDDWVKKRKELPCKCDAVNRAEQEKHQKRQGKVDQRLRVFRQKKQIFGDVDLGKDRRVADQRHQSLGGRLAEKAEDNGTAEEIGGIVRDRAAEEVAEDDAHDQQCHQRVQNTPGCAEKAALILSVKVSLDQLFKQKAVFFQYL